MTKHRLKAPFPYYGNKLYVADEVWRRFGRVDAFVEPFCGSCGVLLGAPWPSKRIEIVNDMDAMVTNFWRAVARKPKALARKMINPVNEIDLQARQRWMCDIDRKKRHQERMRADPHYFNLTIAAWWCWGLCIWIGRGWCEGVWDTKGHKIKGVGTGLLRMNLPRVRHGQGAAAAILGGGKATKDTSLEDALIEWFVLLHKRLLSVRVCCGDWTRMVSKACTYGMGTCAVFLDPPYSVKADRVGNIYNFDDTDVSNVVREWAIMAGENKKMRIAFCGYEGEHTMPEGWTKYKWKAMPGYATLSKQEVKKGMNNRVRERIWFSPHCLSPKRGLFQ